MKPRNTEQIDGKNLLGCKMNSIFPRTLDLLVSDGGSGGCKLVKHDGTELTSQVRITPQNVFHFFFFLPFYHSFFFLFKDKDCLEKWANPDGEDHSQVHFACVKASYCGEKIY